MSSLPSLIEQGLPPTIIDDTNPNDIYVGYMRFSKKDFPFTFIIKRIIISIDIRGNKITTIKYPFGCSDFRFNWDLRFTYEYRKEGDISIEGAGQLYSLLTVQDAKNICPVGYRLAVNADIATLNATLGGAGNGYKLKKAGSKWWKSADGVTAGNDLHGFGAMGSGYATVGTTGNGVFLDFAKGFKFWGNTETLFGGQRIGPDGMFSVYALSYLNNNFSTTTGIASELLSLRFIKEDSIDIGYCIQNDGQMLKTCKIGDQVWTAENSTETMYRDGSIIPIADHLDIGYYKINQMTADPVRYFLF